MFEDVHITEKHQLQVAKICHICNMDIFCHFKFCQNKRNVFCTSLVLFMLIRPLWRLRRIPLLQTHKWMACVYLCTVIQSKKYSWISYWNINSKISPKCIDLFLKLIYHKVASSRPVYYSILDSLGQRSQYIIIKFPLHKQSENPWMCY